jgi:hypothetical protein
MYSGTTQQTAQPRPDVLTVNVIQRFEGINCRTSSLLSNIQDKLHQILSLRAPEQMDKPGDVAPMPNDFASALDVKLNEAQQNEDKLEIIFNHLCQIT